MNARISARAQSDLDRIFAYIFVRGGEKAADRFLELAQEATEFLVQNPLAGPHPRWATRHRTLRFWVISKTNFLIFYLPDEHGVSIERVLDGRKDLMASVSFYRKRGGDRWVARFKQRVAQGLKAIAANPEWHPPVPDLKEVQKLRIEQFPFTLL